MSDDSSREDRILRGLGQLILFSFFVVLTFGSAIGGLFGGDLPSTGSSAITWDTYDVTIDVREDGSMRITEAQEITFGRTFSTGFVEIPMERIESIDNVSVMLEEAAVVESGSSTTLSYGEEPEGELVDARQVPWEAYTNEPNTFRARQEGGLFLIDYAFEPTSMPSLYSLDRHNNTRTIVIEYDAHGVIRDYLEAEEPWQQFHWMAISSDVTAIAPIRNASVTVDLPQDVPVEELVVAPIPDSRSGSSITWTMQRLDEGDSFDVQAAFPAITEATSPAWQEAADARDASIEQREARANAGRLMLLLAGIFIAVIGGLVLVYTWFRSIREPHVGLVHDTLAEPPGEMPAILVGSLLDEEVHPQDIAAGVLDLDRQGIITIRQGEPDEPERYYLILNDAVPAGPAWARELLQTVFGADAAAGATTGFSSLRNLFQEKRSAMQHAIDQTLVAEGYYEELPATSRKHWRWITRGFAAIGAVVAMAILIWSQSWTWWAMLPAVMGVALSWFAKKLTPHVAMKTLKGAEVAAQWRAFRRHLDETRWRRSAVGREQDDQMYAPWLLAFGMNRNWLAEMNRAPWDTAAPNHTGKLSRPDPSTWVWGESSSRSPATVTSSRGAGGRRSVVDPPSWRPTTRGWDPGQWGDLQSVSDRAGGRLSSASSSMFTMIGDMLEALGSSSGGSGGGRSSSSGSSFRGSSSRSGGGRSRSSSGGGRRGFR